MAPSLEQLLDLLYLLPVGVMQFDDEGTVSLMNPLVVQMMMPGVGVADLANAYALLAPIMPDARDRVRAAGANGALGSAQGALASGGGAKRVVEAHLHRARGLNIAVMLDVTEQVATNGRLIIEEQRYRAIIHAVRGCAIFSIDNAGTVDSWNESAERVFHTDDGEGRGLGELVPVGADLQPVLSAARATGWQSLGMWVLDDDGERRWLETLLSPLEAPGSDGKSGFVAVTQDQTEQRLREETLQTEAMTDPLTGLPNRRALQQHHQTLVTAAAEPNAVLMLDLDHFKSVNDTHGHDVGDQVLVAVAAVLRSCSRDSDRPGRLGGEEFALMLARAPLSTALVVAERIRAGVQALQIPVKDGAILRVTTSIGVARLDADLDQALQEADTALYAAKRGGRNQVVLAQTVHANKILLPSQRKTA